MMYNHVNIRGGRASQNIEAGVISQSVQRSDVRTTTIWKRVLTPSCSEIKISPASGHYTVIFGAGEEIGWSR